MFAAVVHYYYRDSWEMMRAQLKHVSHLLDIYFTTPDEKREEAEREIRPLFPEAKIISRPNGGMDIGPFLSVLPELKARGYTHVCKLHTKDVKDQVSRLWFSWMIRALIGNEDAVKTVRQAFLEDQRVTSIGVAGLFLSARRSMFGNLSTVESLYQRVYGTDLPLDDWGFFAGTMFWSRLDRLLPVAEEALGMTELFDKACGDDGHLVHALERVMGCVWNHDQLQVGLLHPTRLDSSDQEIVIEKTNRSISNYYSGEAVCRYFHLENDLQSLRSSGGFKDYLYTPVFTDAYKNSVDPAAHYCLIGSSRSFSPPVVGSINPEILDPPWLN
jgi:lipopolysaccharide biosynthesis protein